MGRAMPNRSAGKASGATRGRGTLSSDSGQTLLEVALLTPLMVALLFGAIEFGRYAYISILIGNAARAGAAFGAESLPNSANAAGIETAADNDFRDNGQSTSSLTVNSSVSCGCDSGGAVVSEACTGGGAGTCGSGHWVVTVSVTASGTFDSLFRFPGIPKSISVSRICAMRVVQD
jgi:Flp pilus assembly protein TadG